MREGRNIFGEALAPCSTAPMTGYYRDGCCNTGPEDAGLHTICCIMTSDFLAFSKEAGNDLSTPRPEWNFPGLRPGDRWCLCALRWLEAMEAGFAPLVIPEATHELTLEFLSKDDLLTYAYSA